MSKTHRQNRHEEDSPVGDVRRVREELSERFGNDVRKLGDYARCTWEQVGRELGCTLVRKANEPAPLPAKR